MDVSKSSPIGTWIGYMEELEWLGIKHPRACINTPTSRHVSSYEHAHLMEREHSRDWIWIQKKQSSAIKKEWTQSNKNLWDSKNNKLCETRDVAHKFTLYRLELEAFQTMTKFIPNHLRIVVQQSNIQSPIRSWGLGVSKPIGKMPKPARFFKVIDPLDHFLKIVYGPPPPPSNVSSSN